MLPFRRIASDLRELRWGQVIVELVLLIVGILIALAVNGWIEDRRDARAERQYLKRLVRDFDQDLKILDEFTAFEETQVEDGIKACRALADPENVTDREAVSLALNHLMTRRTVRLTRATCSDLIGTGNLRLISNGALRNRIISVYEGNEHPTAITGRDNQSYIDQMYSMYLMDSGLVGMRANSNLKPLDTANRELEASIGMPADVRIDRLWRLAADSLELDVLRNKIWIRTVVSNQAAHLAQAATEQVTSIQQAIAAEPARRWPGATAAPSAR